jgi:CXXX repeat peptide maturase
MAIQFVFPNYELPKEYLNAIESIDHTKIKPTKDGADVWVTDNICSDFVDVPIVYRLTSSELFEKEDKLCQMIEKSKRLNIILTDIESFTYEDFKAYQKTLSRLSLKIEQMYAHGEFPQVNVLTDRIMLSEMNNCGAGATSITLAPNGKFYICPAFYYNDDNEFVGDFEIGLAIKNIQLYQLDHSPICRHCDVWQCKRCIWLNKKTTHEVNTPSHEQCVIAHIERNTSRELLNSIRKHDNNFSVKEEIKEIDYLDPFEKINEWQW